MKNKKKIFKIVSIVILTSLIVFYGYRLIHYSRIYNAKVAVNEDSVTLSKKITNDLYKSDNVTVDGKSYIVTGNYQKNYIYYSGRLWQIVRINDDKSIKVVSASNDYLVNLETKFNDSYINKFINNAEENSLMSLESPEAYLKQTETCIDEIIDINNITCEDISQNKISVLSLSDYEKAGGYESYLNNKTNWWLSNSSSEGNYYVKEDGSVSETKVVHNYGIRLVLTLSEDIVWTKGDGSIENPYIIGEEKADILNQKNVGEYIKFSDKIWRIVSHDEIGTKIVLKDNLELKNYASKGNKFTKGTAIFDYLNESFYNELKNKESIVLGSWEVGHYDALENFEISEKKEEAYVGLLNVYDFFVSDTRDSWILTSPNDYSNTAYIVNDSGELFADYVQNEHYVRPAIYLDGNLKVQSGKGTIEKPYVIEVEDEKEE